MQGKENITENSSDLQKIMENHVIDKYSPNKLLWDSLNSFRQRVPSKHSLKRMKKLDIPVAVFSKKERLKTCVGNEITLIFRSKACSWAASQTGGCTMCGYWNDRSTDELSDENIWNQFIYSLKREKDTLSNSNVPLVFKLFTSGSFCDPKEITIQMQLKILKKLSEYDNIKEIVVESRPEYITQSILDEYAVILKERNNNNNPLYIEFGIGLESSNDFVRKHIINKGFSWKSFETAVTRIHSSNFGIKAYVLFKPPFMNEYSAICDLSKTLRDCFSLEVDTISINPTNIQQHTICDDLERFNMFRSPWLYSLLRVIKTVISQDDLKKTRLISDPSAASKERGIHNCNPRDSSNESSLKILHEFVMTQDISLIPDSFSEDSCWNQYTFELLLN